MHELAAMKTAWTLISLLLLIFFTALPASSEDPFLMCVADTFTISGRGTVVTGTIERGTIKVNDTVELVGPEPTRSVVVVGLDLAGRSAAEASAGQSVGLLLRGAGQDEVRRGQVLAQPGSIRAHQKFQARIDLYPSGEGGRRSPITTGYRPQIQIREASVSGTLSLPDGIESAAPGTTGLTVNVELTEPTALEEGQTVFLREGGRTIGRGEVSKLL